MEDEDAVTRYRLMHEGCPNCGARYDNEKQSCLCNPKWPVPILATNRLPIADNEIEPSCTESDFVLAFSPNTESWGEGWYDHADASWHFCDDFHESQLPVAYWLPLPPQP